MVECILGKTLLIVSGGIEAVPGIQRAKEMGLYVVVSDGSPTAPGFEYADDCIIASTYNVNETVQKAKHYHETVRKFDGAMCIASDVPLTVASVANELGLPGIPIASAELAMDKMAMKIKFHKDGVPIPNFKQIDNRNELDDIIKDWGFPIVIKPVDSRGARGVLRLTEKVELNWAWNHSKKNSPTNRVMVERYLAGPQVSTESMMIDGKCYTVGFSDRNYEFLEKYAPFIIENGGDLPSFLSEEIQDEVKNVVEKAALSMGITNGIVKGDIVVHNDNPYVIELAARLSGGYFCTHEIPMNTGVDLVGNAIKMAIGEKVEPSDLIPKFNRNICQRYYMVGNSHSINHEMKTKINNMDGIEFSDYSNIEENQGFPENSNGWIAMVISSGESKKIAQENAINALKIIGEKK